MNKSKYIFKFNNIDYYLNRSLCKYLVNENLCLHHPTITHFGNVKPTLPFNQLDIKKILKSIYGQLVDSIFYV